MKITKCLMFHKWKKVPDQLGYYGMGFEWFECWDCERCEATADQVRGCKETYQVNYPEDYNYREKND
jgi:hypothetical protein